MFLEFMWINVYAKFIDFSRLLSYVSKILGFRLEGVSPALTFVSLHKSLSAFLK